MTFTFFLVASHVFSNSVKITGLFFKHELYVAMHCLYISVRFPHPPIITDGPRNQTVHAGESVRFTCRLLSDPEYHLEWHRHLLVNGSYVSVNFTGNFRVQTSHVAEVGSTLLPSAAVVG